MGGRRRNMTEIWPPAGNEHGLGCSHHPVGRDLYYEHEAREEMEEFAIEAGADAIVAFAWLDSEGKSFLALLPFRDRTSDWPCYGGQDMTQ